MISICPAKFIVFVGPCNHDLGIRLVKVKEEIVREIGLFER